MGLIIGLSDHWEYGLPWIFLSGSAHVRSVHQGHLLAVDPLSDRSQAQPRQGHP
jgi:hypothetical protein